MALPFVRRFATVLQLVTVTTLTGLAQKANRHPEEQPRKIKPEPKKAYTNWVNDVALILTAPERAAWDKLQTDDEREKFIAIFWDQRDPDPDKLDGK